VQISSSLYDFQSRLIGIEVLQFIIEHCFHWCPTIGRSVGDIVQLNSLYEIVVDGSSRKFVTNAATYDQKHGEYPT
jgi:hypothetical protein